MNSLELAREFIKGEEDLRLVAFIPVKGDPWTLGWGRTEDVEEGDTCTHEEADEWLDKKLHQCEAILDSCVHVDLTPGQRAALISFIYNVGNGKAGVKDGLCHLKKGGQSHLLIYTNEKKFSLAADEFLKWDNAHGVELPGLHARRERERALFLTGDDNEIT